MINDEYKFIFQHLPKTGGGSVVEWIRANIVGNNYEKILFYGHKNGVLSHFDNINKYNIKHYQDYFVFSIHRNPWDRMVSLWKWWGGILKKDGKAAAVQNIVRNRSFPEFCLNLFPSVQKIKDIREMIHFMPQANLNGHSEYLKVDYWIRFDHLNEDFKYVAQKLNIPYEVGDLPIIHKIKSKHYTEYYDKKSIDLVSKIYGLDIKKFGYKFGEN